MRRDELPGVTEVAAFGDIHVMMHRRKRSPRLTLVRHEHVVVPRGHSALAAGQPHGGEGLLLVIARAFDRLQAPTPGFKPIPIKFVAAQSAKTYVETVRNWRADE